MTWARTLENALKNKLFSNVLDEWIVAIHRKVKAEMETTGTPNPKPPPDS
jgi:hypothetical protein